MGHISPLISVINYMKNDYKFIYFGLEGSMEEDVCKRYNIKFYSMKLYPFYRKNIFKNFKTIFQIIVERKKINKLFKDYNIKAIISSGGYVSIPLVLSKIKSKKILLESNTTIGLANKFLLRYVDFLGCQFDAIKHKKRIVTGNPITIGSPIFDHPFFYLKDNIILFVGGSNGAFEIVKIANEFNKKYPYIKIFVITGERYFETFTFNENAKVFKKIDNLSSILNKFNLVISRAGASTITELLLSRVAFILIPSKNVSANHQVFNANYIKDKNACEVIYDILDSKNVDLIYNIFSDETARSEMINNQKNLIVFNSLEKLKMLILKE